MTRDLNHIPPPIRQRTAFPPDWSTGSKGWQGGLISWQFLFLLASAVLLAVSAGCTRAPEEERLRQAISTMQSAAEARSPAAVVEWVSADFVGSHGLDRGRMRGLLQAQMLRNASIGVTVGPVDIKLDGPHATVRFIALTTGGSGGLVPDRARAYRVVSDWRLEDGQWRIYRAGWVAE